MGGTIMLDKIEIYPYQRIAEHSLSSRHARKKTVAYSSLAYGWWTKANLRGKILPALYSLATIDNLLIGGGAVLMARAFVLGELLPFIFAFAAAFGYGHRQRLFMLLAGGFIGFLTVLGGTGLAGNLFALAVLGGTLAWGVIPQDRLWWGLPLLTALTVMLSKGLLLLVGDLSFYQVMVTVFEASIAGVLTFVFMVSNEVLRHQKSLDDFTFEDMASFLVVGVGIVMGLSQIFIGGLSVSSIICRLGILVAAFVWGAGGGTMVGVMTGIIPSISSSIFAQSVGLYALSGLLAGLFRNFGRLGVIIGFLMGTLALSMFISETQATILGMWESAVACLAFMLLPSSLKEQAPIKSLGPLTGGGSQEHAAADLRIKETARQKIDALAKIFEELSSTFSAASSSPAVQRDTYLNYLYDEISHGFCENCSRHDSCWGRDCYSTSQEVMDIFSLAEAKGHVEYEECPVEFRRRCIYGREMVNTINYLFDNLRINEYWSAKLGETRNLVAQKSLLSFQNRTEEPPRPLKKSTQTEEPSRVCA